MEEVSVSLILTLRNGKKNVFSGKDENVGGRVRV